MSSFKDTTKLLKEEADKGSKAKELQYKLNSVSLKPAAKSKTISESKNTSDIRYKQLKDK